MDVFIDEREMVRSDFAGDAEAALFGRTDLIERGLGGEVSDVEAGAGELDELNVASDADGFGGGGHAAEAETRGSDAFAHDGSSG